jgi:hypothetical protein
MKPAYWANGSSQARHDLTGVTHAGGSADAQMSVGVARRNNSEDDGEMENATTGPTGDGVTTLGRRE